MQIVIDIPEEVYKDIQSLDWKNGERWFSEEWKAIHNGTPCETVTEFADRCRECGAKYGKLLKQEPCEDAISRQAVLDLMRSLTRWCVKSEDRKFENVGLLYDDVMFGIDRLPSVTPIQRWIPVSEMLPEVKQRVLVTSYGRVCYAMMISADANSGHPVFKLQDSLNERVVCETTVHNEFTTSRIKAWMPLPEPYKAESEDSDANSD